MRKGLNRVYRIVNESLNVRNLTSHTRVSGRVSVLNRPSSTLESRDSKVKKVTFDPVTINITSPQQNWHALFLGTELTWNDEWPSEIHHYTTCHRAGYKRVRGLFRNYVILCHSLFLRPRVQDPSPPLLPYWVLSKDLSGPSRSLFRSDSDPRVDPWPTPTGTTLPTPPVSGTLP